MHRLIMHFRMLQKGGGPLSFGGGVDVHLPSEQVCPLLAQSWQASAPAPHVVVDSPPAQKPFALQQPPQVVGPHGGAASTTSTSGSSVRSSRASTCGASMVLLASLASSSPLSEPSGP